jgi:hypothetical protein
MQGEIDFAAVLIPSVMSSSIGECAHYQQAVESLTCLLVKVKVISSRLPWYSAGTCRRNQLPLPSRINSSRLQALPSQPNY